MVQAHFFLVTLAVASASASASDASYDLGATLQFLGNLPAFSDPPPNVLIPFHTGNVLQNFSKISNETLQTSMKTFDMWDSPTSYTDDQAPNMKLADYLVDFDRESKKALVAVFSCSQCKHRRAEPWRDINASVS